MSIYINCNGAFPKVYADFGDGNDTTFYVLRGSTPDLIHTYRITGKFHPYFIVTDTFYKISDTLNRGLYRVANIVSNDCASISGSLYMDNNSDCKLDQNEKLTGQAVVSRMHIEIDSGGDCYSYTDIFGNYSVELPIGYNYTINPELSTDGIYGANYPYMLYPYCPINSAYKFSPLSPGVHQDMNFGYRYDLSNKIDMSCSIVSDTFHANSFQHIFIFAGSNTKAFDTVAANVSLL